MKKQFAPNVGDQVIIRNGTRSGAPFKIRKVVKLTKTQVEVEGGEKFMLRSGKKIGETGWYTDSLDTWGELTIDDAIKQNNKWHKENDIKILRNRIRYFEWQHVSDEKLIRIMAILDEKS